MKDKARVLDHIADQFEIGNTSAHDFEIWRAGWQVVIIAGVEIVEHCDDCLLGQQFANDI